MSKVKYPCIFLRPSKDYSIYYLSLNNLCESRARANNIYAVGCLILGVHRHRFIYMLEDMSWQIACDIFQF